MIVLAALLVCLLGALWIGRNIRLSEYTSNRSRSSFAQILFTNLASLIGGWMFFGLCAIGFEAGVAGFAIGLGYAVGLVILALAIPAIKRRMSSTQSDTMDDFVGSCLGPLAQSCVTFINLLFFLGVLAAQFIAMTAFLRVFAQVEAEWTFYVAVAVVLIYTAAAGFKGVLFTDVWQFLVLTLGATAIFGVLLSNASWHQLAGLDQTFFTGLGYGPAFLIGVLVLFPASLVVRTDLWQRIASAKDAPTAKRAFLVTAPILLAFYVILTSVGILSRAALSPDATPETAGFDYFLAILRARRAMPPLIAEALLAILSLGVFAALLSTADTNLNVVSVALAKLLRRRAFREFEANGGESTASQANGLERSLIWSARLLTLGLGLLSLVIAKAIPDIVNLIVAAGSAVMVFLPMMLVVLIKGAGDRGPAVASVGTGFLALAFLLPFSPKTAFIPATVSAFLAYGAVAMIGRRFSRQPSAIDR